MSRNRLVLTILSSVILSTSFYIFFIKTYSSDDSVNVSVISNPNPRKSRLPILIFFKKFIMVLILSYTVYIIFYIHNDRSIRGVIHHFLHLVYSPDVYVRGMNWQLPFTCHERLREHVTFSFILALWILSAELRHSLFIFYVIDIYGFYSVSGSVGAQCVIAFINPILI
ncbi:hypothetical protein PEC106664_20070 [Pectobacterium carotovorum subsp. carotovorum]|nr:hypothetical protein PEC106664_20070 [Pectobacterium carotovorum subsp. carotovorum]